MGRTKDVFVSSPRRSSPRKVKKKPATREAKPKIRKKNVKWKWPKIQITLNTFRFFFAIATISPASITWDRVFYALREQKYYIYNVMKHLLTNGAETRGEWVRWRGFFKMFSILELHATHFFSFLCCVFLCWHRLSVPRVALCFFFIKTLSDFLGSPSQVEEFPAILFSHSCSFSCLSPTTNAAFFLKALCVRMSQMVGINNMMHLCLEITIFHFASEKRQRAASSGHLLSTCTRERCVLFSRKV